MYIQALILFIRNGWRMGMLHSRVADTFNEEGLKTNHKLNLKMTSLIESRDINTILHTNLCYAE